MRKNKIVIVNLLCTIILQGLAYLSAPIFSSALGTSNFGIASVYYTWVRILSVVFTLQAAGAVGVARTNFPESEQKQYQSSIFFFSICSYGILSIITIIIALLVVHISGSSFGMLLCALVHGIGLYCVNSINAKFTYEFKAWSNLIVSVVTSVSSIVTSYILIFKYPSDINYWGRIIGQAVPYGIIGVLICIYIFINGRTFYNKEYWLFTLPITIPIVLHDIANLLLNQSDRLMLQWLTDNSSVGIYSLAATFSGVLASIYMAFNNSWVSFYYEYSKNKNYDAIKESAKNYLEVFTTITCGFILLANEVYHVFAREDYWSGTSYIYIFAVGYYLVFLYSFPVGYEFYNKKTKYIAFATSMATVCNIILNYLLIKSVGVLGAVIATAIAHGFQFLFHYIAAKRIDADEFPFQIRFFLPWLGIVCVTALLSKVLIGAWLIRWGIGVALGVIVGLRIIKRRRIF